MYNLNNKKRMIKLMVEIIVYKERDKIDTI